MPGRLVPVSLGMAGGPCDAFVLDTHSAHSISGRLLPQADGEFVGLTLRPDIPKHRRASHVAPDVADRLHKTRHVPTSGMSRNKLRKVVLSIHSGRPLAVSSRSFRMMRERLPHTLRSRYFSLPHNDGHPHRPAATGLSRAGSTRRRFLPSSRRCPVQCTDRGTSKADRCLHWVRRDGRACQSRRQHRLRQFCSTTSILAASASSLFRSSLSTPSCRMGSTMRVRPNDRAMSSLTLILMYQGLPKVSNETSE